MNLDDVHQCWWCKRLNTVTEYVQRYVSPVVMRVEECSDQDDCELFRLRIRDKVGVR